MLQSFLDTILYHFERLGMQGTEKEFTVQTCLIEGNTFECDLDGFVNFGDISREFLKLQAQYGSSYVRGISDTPNLGIDLRFKNLNTSSYHDIMIHKDDIAVFVDRYWQYKERGVIPTNASEVTSKSSSKLENLFNRLVGKYFVRSRLKEDQGDNLVAPSIKDKITVGNNFQARIEKAFLQNNLDECFDVLADLDETLTGNRCSNGQAGAWKRQINDFLVNYEQGKDPDETFYLSDGGFSRLYVCLSFDDRTKIISKLTPNSSDIVKEKWEKIK